MTKSRGLHADAAIFAGIQRASRHSLQAPQTVLRTDRQSKARLSQGCSAAPTQIDWDRGNIPSPTRALVRRRIRIPDAQAIGFRAHTGRSSPCSDQEDCDTPALYSSRTPRSAAGELHCLLRQARARREKRVSARKGDRPAHELVQLRVRVVVVEEVAELIHG